MELLLYTQEYCIIHLQVVSNSVVNKLFITLQAFAWILSEWDTENAVQP